MNLFKNIIKSTVILVLGVVLFSCEKRLNKIQNKSKVSYLPVSIAENINTRHTDSGRLTSILESPKMINFSNRKFPYYQFPDGIDLTLLDDSNQESVVIANSAVIYNNTDLIDLRGNVVLTTATNDTLFTDQLYYDQKKEWLFTDFPVKFRTKDYLTNGNGFDANQDFTNAQVLEVTGRIYIEE
ncbi:MAG: LPS export ABC transporter periplasmic protein LptC [Bacteroidetes bacterium]|nr:LPS export ABC transporter periplasmic protein LptC [Bacteroidota bacterium]MDA1175859.1 LPS export ABC transporter periplasmic protein LptC [Bacteroidota bacterium]